jgi:glycosyltransferase involved in cell wall biosynthesis
VSFASTKNKEFVLPRSIKVLALTRYDRLGASSRLRFLQFIPGLANHGLAVENCPLFEDEYLERFYSGQKIRPFRDVAIPMVKRVWSMLQDREYDVVWVEKESFPFIPWFFERLAGLRMPPVVVDYDDAVFHSYDMHRFGLVQKVLGRKIDHVMAQAQCVVAGNSYLANRAKLAGARKIVTIPTVLDPERYPTKVRSGAEPFRIGWIGTKSTSVYLRSISPALAQAVQKLGAEIVIIGAEKLDLPGVNPTYVRWSEETEAAELRRLTVGIMPLTDNPWDRGKCGYKLLQYMACGLPVVASPVGVNSDIVSEGETGFLAKSDDEWYKAFKFMFDSADTAAALGSAGRLRLESIYSIKAALPQIERCLREAAQA